MPKPFSIMVPLGGPEPAAIELTCRRDEPAPHETPEATEHFHELTDDRHETMRSLVATTYQRIFHRVVSSSLREGSSIRPRIWLRGAASRIAQIKGNSWSFAALIALALGNQERPHILEGLRPNEQLWCTGTLNSKYTLNAREPLSPSALEELRTQWQLFNDANPSVARYFLVPANAAQALREMGAQTLTISQFVRRAMIANSRELSGRWVVSIGDSPAELARAVQVLSDAHYVRRLVNIQRMISAALFTSLTVITAVTVWWMRASYRHIEVQTIPTRIPIADSGVLVPQDSSSPTSCRTNTGDVIASGHSISLSPCLHCNCTDGMLLCTNQCDAPPAACHDPRNAQGLIDPARGWVQVDTCQSCRCVAGALECRSEHGCHPGAHVDRVALPSREPRDAGSHSATGGGLSEQQLIERMQRLIRQAHVRLQGDPDDIGAFRALFSSELLRETVALGSRTAANMLYQTMVNFSTRECRYWLPLNDHSFWNIYQRRAELYPLLGINAQSSQIRRCTHDQVQDIIGR